MKNPEISAETHVRPDAGTDWSSGAADLRGEVYHPPEYLAYLEKATDALKTVRIIVYAGMTGFVILAIYGFFLVYQLTNDVHRAVAQTELMTQQMQAMTRIMANMHESVSVMGGDIKTMNSNTDSMNGSMAQLASNMKHMTNTVALMQHSASNLDQSIGPVMGTFNRMMPFGMTGNNYNGAPAYAPMAR